MCFGFQSCDINRSFQANIERFRFVRQVYLRTYINTYVYYIHTKTEKQTQKIEIFWSENSNFFNEGKFSKRK